MSERPKSDIVEKIRKILLKTAESGATAAESETAIAMANRLLALHNLTLADVKVEDNDHCESFIQEAALDAARWTLEYNLAYHIIKEFFFVEGILIPSDGGNILFLFGTESNVAVAKYTIKALLASFERLWATYRILNKRPASEKRLFVSGVASGFSTKLRDERKAMEVERDLSRGSSGGTALALRNIADETAIKFKERHPKTTTGRRGNYAETKGDRSTFDAGVDAGRNLSLNRAVGGRSRTKAISN